MRSSRVFVFYISTVEDGKRRVSRSAGATDDQPREPGGGGPVGQGHAGGDGDDAGGSEESVREEERSRPYVHESSGTGLFGEVGVAHGACLPSCLPFSLILFCEVHRLRPDL